MIQPVAPAQQMETTTMTTFRKFDHLKANENTSQFFDDFFRYTAGDWVITTTEAGAGDATEAIADEANGVLLITNDAADNDLDALQLAKETFKLTVGKKLMFKMRFKVDDATQCDLVLGLHIRDTSPFASAPSDGIFFRKDDDDKLLDFVVGKNSTYSTLLGKAGTLTELANDTWRTVEFYYDGGPLAASTGVDAGKIAAFVDGTRVGALPMTNAPDDEELAISFAIQNGSAVARNLRIDYILVRQER